MLTAIEKLLSCLHRLARICRSSCKPWCSIKTAAMPNCKRTQPPMNWESINIQTPSSPWVKFRSQRGQTEQRSEFPIMLQSQYATQQSAKIVLLLRPVIALSFSWGLSQCSKVFSETTGHRFLSLYHVVFTWKIFQRLFRSTALSYRAKLLKLYR